MRRRLEFRGLRVWNVGLFRVLGSRVRLSCLGSKSVRE